MGKPEFASVRASSLPMAFRCPGSLQPAKVRLDPHNPAGNMGTAVHAALRPLAESGRVPWSNMPTIAAEYGVHEAELRALCGVGAKLWDEVRDSFPGALTEAELEAEFSGVRLTGHVDLVSLGPSKVRGGDWKTGRKDSDYSQQLRGYAALLMATAPDPLDEVTMTALWLRTREVENYTMDRADYNDWQREFRSRIVNWDGVYHPSNDCGYCRRFHECEAAQLHARAAVAVVADRQILDDVEFEIDRFSPDELIDLVHKCTAVTQYAERARDAIRHYVQRHGDIVGNDYRLTLEARNERIIDPLEAWPILEESGFTDEDLASCVKLSASRLDKVVASKAPRGTKKYAIQELNEKLEQAGALIRAESQALTTRRK